MATPTGTPIQDKDSMPIHKDFPAEPAQSNVVTPAEDRMLDEVDDNISIASSSQEKLWKTNFTSPTYQQQEVARRGDADDFLAMSPSTTPKVTLAVSPRTTPQVMPKATPQSSPGHPTLPHQHFGDVLEVAHRVRQWDEAEDCFPFQTQLHECSFMEFCVISPCLYEYYKSLWPFQQSSRSQDIVIISYPSQRKRTNVHNRDDEIGPVDHELPITVLI